MRRTQPCLLLRDSGVLFTEARSRPEAIFQPGPAVQAPSGGTGPPGPEASWALETCRTQPKSVGSARQRRQLRVCAASARRVCGALRVEQLPPSDGQVNHASPSALSGPAQ